MAKRWILACTLILPVFLVEASSLRHPANESREMTRPGAHDKTQGQSVPFSILLSKGLPQSMVSIDLDIYRDGRPEKPRLAVLRPDGLRIFSVRDDKLLENFFLGEPPVPWDHMQSLPSRNQPFGVVLWASEEYSYASATVVCYVEGQFKVVFQGQNVAFVDFNFDGVPEILTEEYASEDAKEPQQVTVWAWNGKKYVTIATVPPAQLWSKQIADAVRRTRK